MPTKIKVSYDEQSKCVVSSTSVESDELDAKTVKEMAQKLAIEAIQDAQALTMRFK